MELALGFVLGVIVMALCMRRAAKKPTGKTARFVNALGGGGGGGGPQEPGK
jgi:hypothetical protein